MLRGLTKDKGEAVDELANLRRLLDFDRGKRFKKRAKKPRYCVVGTDEVGRGCLAGPVVAAAVLLPEIPIESELAKSLSELDDSKKLTAPQRERLAAIIHDVAVCSIAESTVAEIDQINILQASLLAMHRALAQLLEMVEWTIPYLVLIDGNKQIPDVIHEQLPVIGGDSVSASVAAASIIAKVHRDRLMTNLSQDFPAYLWHQNKGYGSRAHWEALREHGTTHWHRRLFCARLFELGSDVDRILELDQMIED